MCPACAIDGVSVTLNGVREPVSWTPIVHDTRASVNSANRSMFMVRLHRGEDRPGIDRLDASAHANLQMDLVN